jgi:hypothetical protein
MADTTGPLRAVHSRQRNKGRSSREPQLFRLRRLKPDVFELSSEAADAPPVIVRVEVTAMPMIPKRCEGCGSLISPIRVILRIQKREYLWG